MAIRRWREREVAAGPCIKKSGRNNLAPLRVASCVTWQSSTVCLLKVIQPGSCQSRAGRIPAGCKGGPPGRATLPAVPVGEYHAAVARGCRLRAICRKQGSRSKHRYRPPALLVAHFFQSRRVLTASAPTHRPSTAKPPIRPGLQTLLFSYYAPARANAPCKRRHLLLEFFNVLFPIIILPEDRDDFITLSPGLKQPLPLIKLGRELCSRPNAGF